MMAETDMSELLYWLGEAVSEINRRIDDKEPFFDDPKYEEAYKFGLRCAYDMLKSRLEDVTDIHFEEMIP